MFEIGDHIKYNGLNSSHQRKDLTIEEIYIVRDKKIRYHLGGQYVRYTIIDDNGWDLSFDEGSPVGLGFEKIKQELNFLNIIKEY